jgi:sulfatase maturation enzyme AslB (radical SAM superfamily)
MCGQGEIDMSRAEGLAEELGVDYIQFKPEISQNNLVFKPSKDISFFTERYDGHRSTACDIAGLIGIITADGRYVYCCQHRYEPKYTIADLRKTSLEMAIISRGDMDIDNTQCKLCRYSNYAEEYTRYKERHHAYMRHREFL